MRRPLRDAGALLAIALLTGVLLLFALLYQREAALQSGAQQADSLSRVIGEQTGRTLQSAEQALQVAALRLEALRQAGGLDDGSGGEVLGQQVADLPFLRNLWLLDAEGAVELDASGGEVDLPQPAQGFFDPYRRGPASEFHIGLPMRSPGSGGWVLTVTRPVRAPDGSVRQLLVGALEPHYFEQLWRDVDHGRSGTVALYHSGGQLLARTPVQESIRGRDFSSLPLFTDYLSRADEGTYIRDSAVDGVRRVVAYRKLPVYPELVVLVGAGYQELLAPWNRFATLTGTIWAAAVAIAVALTSQLRRQARIRERTEQRFQQLARAVPQIVFVMDDRGAVRFVNDRWSEVTGRSRAEAMGTGWQQALHPRAREGAVQRLGQMLETGGELQLEERLLYRDGSYRWQLLRAVPVQEEGEAGLSWFGTATDIDALKRAQQRLHEQAEQLRMAGRLTRMGAWRIDLARQCVQLSEEAAAILDLPPRSEQRFQRILDLLTGDSAAAGLSAIRRCAEEGVPFDLEVEMRTPTGRHVWIRSMGEPVRDADGRITGIQGAHQDITLRVLMMEEIRGLNASLEERIEQRTAELARQEALFRTLAEQAPLPFWTVDPRGAVTFLSRAWYALAGGAPPDWHGQQWLRLVHPDDVLSVQQNWVRSAATGEPYTGTRRLRGRDGRYHTMNYRAVPVRDGGGSILFWVGVDSDITDMMAKEAALRLANQQLEAFSYSVSHDLQSPLQRVASYARLLQEELQETPGGRARHYLARIQANADTMAQLIEGLLALAHVSEVEVIRAAVNLSEIAVEILERLQSQQPERQVQWHVEPGLTVAGDARLMRSVMENLIGNAWKFTSGQPVAEIVVGGSRERGEYFVRDTGCGFDMAYADRLFGTFQRLHGADEFPGTGIGLATVARAITRQGGRVWAHSVQGQGATFWFTLPAAHAPGADASLKAASAA